MIERINFYDLYGYLIPGVSLIGILWFPFWFRASYGLPSEWTSAFGILVLGYVGGHALRTLSSLAFPHGRLRDRKRHRPSSYVLDADDGQIATDVKLALFSLIRGRFGIDAMQSENRSTAFMLCRRALLQHNAGSYAEQFEGLYVMMRAWTTVGWLSAAYHLGWALAHWIPLGVAAAGVIAFATAVLAKTLSDYHRERRVRQLRRQASEYDPWGFRLLAALLFALGILLDTSVAAIRDDATPTAVLLSVAAVSVVLAFGFHGGYHYFAELFAVTVYRDFFVLERYRSPDATGGEPPSTTARVLQSLLERLVGAARR